RSAAIRRGVLRRDQKRGTWQDHDRSHWIEAFDLRTTLGATMGLCGIVRCSDCCRRSSATLPRHFARAAERGLDAAGHARNSVRPNETELVIGAPVFRANARVRSSSHPNPTTTQAVRALGFA